MEEQNTNKSPWKKWFWISGITLTLVLAAFLFFRYWFVYSEGTRVGILYKFSRKGTVFKTYEGEMLLPGLSTKRATEYKVKTNNFFFSVADEALAEKLMNSQGMEVEVHYSYYNRPLPWRGDSYEEEPGQYVVDRLIKIKDKNPNGYGF